VGYLFSAAAPTGHQTRLLTLTHALTQGEVLTLGDFDVRAGTPPVGAVEARFLDRLEGKRLARSVAAGKVLHYADIEWGDQLRTRIPAGSLAYSLPAASDLRLAEGDRVDLFLAPSAGGPLQQLLSGAVVLEAAEGVPPVLALNEEEIRWVETAGQKGKLKIAIRSSREAAPGQRLRRSSGKSQRRHAIQVWEDGE